MKNHRQITSLDVHALRLFFNNHTKIKFSKKERVKMAQETSEGT